MIYVKIVGDRRYFFFEVVALLLKVVVIKDVDGDHTD